jgi:SPOR domain
MSPLDTGFPRDPEVKKRMLPSVTDVVRELAKVISADPAVLFKAARGVVAEELAKVKQGLESAPLDVLVRRARLQLERDGSAKPVSGPAAPFTPVFPARRPVLREAQKAAPPAPDEPFENAPSRAELGWEKEIPIHPEDAPFRSAVIPIPHEARGPIEISAPADTSPRPVPEPKPKPARAPQPRPELELDFATPPPAPHEPAVKSMSDMAPLREMFDEKPEPEMQEFNFKAAEGPAPVPARAGRRGWLVAIALVLAIGAGLAWAVREYVFRNEIVRPVAPAARKKPDAAPVEAPAPAPVPAAVPAPPPAKAAPAPAKLAAAGPPSGAAVPKGRAAVLLTPDWAGKPDVYVIHFSSHKDRESAAKEAKKLGAALGAPARAVEVDLGEKGVWYRVVLGEFADLDAARAFRTDLETKKTPGMGFVYEMRGR